MARSLASLEQGPASPLETGTGHSPPQHASSGGPLLVLHAPTSNDGELSGGEADGQHTPLCS